MYCKTCGKEMNDSQVVCLSCGCEKGTGQNYCAKCGAKLNKDAAVCMSCGVSADFGSKKSSSLSKGNDGWCPADKDKMVAIILAFFLGAIGIHNFYLGETKKGIFKIVMDLFLLGGIFALIDFVKMLTGSYEVSTEKLI